MQLIISSIKLDKHNGPTMKYQRLSGVAVAEDCTFPAADFTPSAVSVEFTQLFDELLDTVTGFVGLDDGWQPPFARITGMSVKHVDGAHGCTITAQRRFEDDGAYVAVVNSPYLSPERLSQSEQMLVARILKAAEEYLVTELKSQPVQEALPV